MMNWYIDVYTIIIHDTLSYNMCFLKFNFVYPQIHISLYIRITADTCLKTNDTDNRNNLALRFAYHIRLMVYICT